MAEHQEPAAGRAARVRIAIIGGGAAGTLTACELLRGGAAVDIDVFEPRGVLGTGLAYSTQDPRHVVNVPAGKMSAVHDDAAHLTRWLEARGDDHRDEAFPQRRVYGEYVRELLAERRAAATDATLTEHVDQVVELHRTGDDGDGATNDVARYRLVTRAGAEHHADAVVLALGNVSAPPAIELPADDRCFTSPWELGALDASDLRGDAAILIIGTGLTAVDAALSLADAAPGAHLVLASRNGQLPMPHLPGPLRAPWPSDTFPTNLTSMDELLAAWEAHVQRGLDAGHDWRDVVDGLRPKTQLVWRALDEEGQRTFLREHRRRWEARRNRPAPSVGDRLAELQAEGRLEVHGGGVTELRVDDAGLVATVGDTEHHFDRVVSATGPTADVRRTTNPLLQQLFADGIAAPDPHHLAVRTDDDGAVRDSSGAADPTLMTLGWMRRGELWETLAIPEIRAQAATIADLLSRRTAPGSPRSSALAR